MACHRINLLVLGRLAREGILIHLWPCHCFSQLAIRTGGLLVLAMEEIFASLSPLTLFIAKVILIVTYGISY